MSNRQTNTSFSNKEKENAKLTQKNSITKVGEYSNVSPFSNLKRPTRGHAAPSISPALVTNPDAIRRSTSFKYQELPYRKPLGCTYYDEGFCHKKDDSTATPNVLKAKSKNRKKQLTSMHKTAAHWNVGNSSIIEYEDSTLVVGKPYKKSCFIGRKESIPQSSVLPKIDSTGKGQFDAENSSNKEDSYIAYIKNKKKLKAETGYLNITKQRNERIQEHTPITSARRFSKEKQQIKAGDSKSFVMNGINFEVHSRKSGSPTESVEQLKGQITKEMSLMFYDFNGAAQRIHNESPPLKENSTSKNKNGAESTLRRIYQNKTTEKFYKAKKGRSVNKVCNKVNNTTSTHDGTWGSNFEEEEDQFPPNIDTEIKLKNEAKIYKQTNLENKQIKNPPLLSQITNNGILYIYFNCISS